MRLLQRYIFFELLRVFTFVLSVLTLLLVCLGVFREVSENGLGPLEILKILPFIVPSLLPFTIPATLLLTVCVVYGRMAGDREIIAAKAAGINVLSLLWPSFFLGGVLSVGTLLLTDQVIPWAVVSIERVVTMAMEDIFLDVLRTQNHLEDRNHGIAITVRGVSGKKLIKPVIRYAPSGKSAITIQAHEATVRFDLKQQQAILHLVRGHVDVPGQGRMSVMEIDQPFPLPNGDRKAKPRHLSIQTIHHELADSQQLQQRGEQRRDVETALALAMGDFRRFTDPAFTGYEQQIRAEVGRSQKLYAEIHTRFALASSCFFFVLFGSPFAIVMARKQFLTSFFLCFLPILVVYYPLMMLMMNLSKSGTVDPLWGSWVPNLLLLGAAALALRKVTRH